MNCSRQTALIIPARGVALEKEYHTKRYIKIYKNNQYVTFACLDFEGIRP